MIRSNPNPAVQAARLARRLELKIEYDSELPVVKLKDAIGRSIAENQVVIVCGETGSGKTTQLPKICLELGRGIAGAIGHTQPRRVAARTVAARIAAELKTELGGAVGFKVRFQDKSNPESFIKLMTDGILLAETQTDSQLSQYDTLIIDEAHERSLNIDFLLGFLKELAPSRPDLKLIITSATIDASRFSRHFDNAPIVEVSGRSYPVEIRYRPPPEDETLELDQLISAAVDEAELAHPYGDMLIFLPGEREIRSVAETLRKHHPGGVEILPLYARLSASEQERVFRQGSSRRIVLATNVAETSLTVPNIGVVIDPGLARINRYSYRNKVEQLLVEKISRASANQRAGRCGRVMAGLCLRLYSEEDFASRPEYTDPEILRSSLAAVILRMKSLGLADVEQFPFLDAPLPRMISDGYQLLAELGAVNEERELTSLGSKLAKLPIDPRIGRMILAARDENCLTEVLIIAAMLATQDPRDRPAERQQEADAAHQQFTDERSEFLGFLKLWDYFKQASEQLSGRKLLAECRKRFLSLQRLREWRDLHGQIQALVLEMGMKPNQAPAGYDEIHRALLCGLLGNIGFKSEEDGLYLGARAIKFRIFPGSKLKKRPKWLMAADITETARLYARTVAEINPEWIEKAGAHLLKKRYFEAHWEKSRAQVVAFEQSSLYGLIVNPKKRVHYGPINPTEAHQLFIRGALVAGEYQTRAPFFEHNRELIRQVEQIEHKSRRADVLVDEERLYRFYSERIPESINQGSSFERWLKQEGNGEKLLLTRELLMKHAAEAVTFERFPDSIQAGGIELALKYRFEPGHVLDGVTVTLPLHHLNKFDSAPFDWLVPGLLREKMTWLLRSLPKNFRNKLVPVAEHVTRALDEMPDHSQPFLGSLTAALKKSAGIEVPIDAWNLAQLPLHLRMNYRVVDEQGIELAMGRDLRQLQQQLGAQAEADYGTDEFEKQNIMSWNFGDLPEQVEFKKRGESLLGFPAIVDAGDSVSLCLLDTPEKARAKTRQGLLRLFRFELKPQLAQIEKNIPKPLLAACLHLGDAQRFREQVLDLLIRICCLDGPVIRAEAEFRSRLAAAKPKLHPVSLEVFKLLGEILDSSQRIKGKLNESKAYPYAIADMTSQLSHLLHSDFIAASEYQRLKSLPRYLKAIELRIEKLPGAAARDQEATAEIQKRWKQYAARLEQHRKQGLLDAALEEYRWLIEELRVSLFAQELKTPMPISTKRLDKYWESVSP